MIKATITLMRTLFNPAIINIIILYLGKISGVLVAFIFIPFYNKLLGADQFGIVALILSLQALFMIFDFGLITIVSRDISTNESKLPNLSRLFYKTEISISAVFLLLTIIIISTKFLFGLSLLRYISTLLILVMFWLLVLHTLYYSSLLAKRIFILASALQSIGVIVRALVTVFAMANGHATIEAFVIIQTIFVAIHCIVMRYHSFRLLELNTIPKPKNINCKECVALLKSGKSLMLFSIAGAAVMQLDKPIVSNFISVTSMTPYFLATTLSLTPIMLIGSPISQYFQPILLRAIADRRPAVIRKKLEQFVLAILLIIGPSSVILWFLRLHIIYLWLGSNAYNTLIAEYVAILLPACAITTFGYITYSILISAKDYKFQAILSTYLTIITLIGTAIASLLQSVQGVCYVYATYHLASVILQWGRTIYLPSTRDAGIHSATLSLMGILLIFGIGFLNYFFWEL